MMLDRMRDLITKYGLFTYSLTHHMEGDFVREYGSSVESSSTIDLSLVACCEYHKLTLNFEADDEAKMYKLNSFECDQDLPEYEIPHLVQSAKEKKVIHDIVCEFADELTPYE